jgi:hypothetical protein
MNAAEGIPSDTDDTDAEIAVAAPGRFIVAVRMGDAGLVPAAFVANKTYEHDAVAPPVTGHGTCAASTGNGCPVTGEIEPAGMDVGAPNPAPVFNSYA